MTDRLRWRCGRASLLQTSATGALLLGALVMPRPAYSQAFQGTANVSSGNATVSTSANTTNISINTSTAIINWTPTDHASTGTIDFLPAGTTATFTGQVAPYTVLNRIIPTDINNVATSRPVAFNGTVNGIGGNIWFYSPGGIVVGSTGIFNVGGLILTTDDIDTTQGVVQVGVGAPSAIHFGVTSPLATSSVQINAGAQINASSYVAIVAPRIVQAGTVTTNGSTAYVAAEKADLTINGGLFDITIGTGTSDPNGIVHTGTTTGPASTSNVDYRRVYLVSLAKNDALTMLLSGTIGYTPAATAANEAGQVVLAAGGGVSSGAAYLPAPLPTTHDAVTITNANFLSSTSGYSTGNIKLTASAGQNVSFTSDATLISRTRVDVLAQGGGQITGGNLIFNAVNPSGTGVTLTATGTGSAITSTGTLSAAAAGIIDPTQIIPPTGSDATGGTLAVQADNGGSISASALQLNAFASAGTGTIQDGNATGGAITIKALTGGSITATTTTSLFAAGTVPQNGVPDHGGNAIGGTATIIANGGTLALGEVDIDTSATASSGALSGGNATGGTINLTVNNATLNWNSLTALVATTGGAAGLGGVAGSAVGSANGFSVDIGAGGTLNIASQLGINAGSAVSFNDGGASTVTGGKASVSVHDGGALTAQQILINATGYSGLNDPRNDTGTAPSATGGAASVDANGGSITVGTLQIQADAFASGNAQAAGLSTGGTAQLSARNGGSVNITGRGTSITANGALLNPSPYGAAGHGGTVLVFAQDGAISIPADLTLQADGFGLGSRLAGVAAVPSSGGSVTLETRKGTAGTANLALGTVLASANADGNDRGGADQFSFGNGGAATGGTVAFNFNAGTVSATSMTLSADATAGNARRGFVGGTGTGGSASINVAGATATVPLLSVTALGTGGGIVSAGSNTAPGTGGLGAGGTASVTVSAGSLTASTGLTLQATGIGGVATGADALNGNNGGAGTGGTASILLPTGGTGQLTLGSLTMGAAGVGAAGGNVSNVNNVATNATHAGNGGAGTGGTARVLLESGSFSAPDLTATAKGTGGVGGQSTAAGVAGGAGGLGRGGQSTLSFGGATTQINTVTADATGVGGAGGASLIQTGVNPASGLPIFGPGADPGGAGGASFGGFGTVTLGADPSFTALSVLATATGGVGGSGGIGAAGGAATGGVAALNQNASALTVSNILAISSAALGGAGGQGATGAGGVGGAATGGASSLTDTGGGTTISVGALAIDANATGGAGGAGGTNGTSTSNGAAGGAATGGTARATTANGAAFTYGQTASITVAAQGGAGAVGTLGGAAGLGGGASGGAASLAVMGGPFTGTVGPRSGALTIATTTQGGSGVAGSGGSASLSITGGTLTVGTTQVSATATNRGSASITNSSGTVSTGALTLAATGTAQGAGDGISFASSGTIFSTGGAATFSGSTVGLTFTGAGGLDVKGAWTVNSTGALNADHLSQSGTTPFESAHASSTGWTAGGAITGNGQTRLRSDGTLGLTAGGGAAFGRLQAGGNITVNAAGNIAGADALSTGGGINWTTTAGRLTGGSLTANQAIVLSAPGGISVTDAIAGTNATLTAVNGAVQVSHNIVGTGPVQATGQSVTLNATGALTVASATATAGNLNITAGGALGVTTGTASGSIILSAPGAVTVGALGAGTTVGITAGGVATFNGATTGTSVAVSSSDIAFGPNGRIGTQGTTSQIALTSTNSTAPAVFGGTAAGAGYTLDANKVQRLFANSISLVVPRAAGTTAGLGGTPDLIIRDVAVSTGANGNLGTNGTLSLSTPGSIRIDGNVALRGIGATGGLSVTAGDTLSIIAGTGAIDLRDANGGLSGVATLTGANLIAATASAISDVAATTDPDVRSTRLSANDGATSDQGIIRAASILLNAGSGLFIQNTGASSVFGDRRGFTADPIAITTGSGTTQIIINGQVITTTQAGVTNYRGLATIPIVTINGVAAGGPGQFDPRSTINGCKIAAAQLCGGGGGNAIPTINVIGGEIHTPLFGKDTFLSLLTFETEIANRYPPLIDEPITGVGNEDLWHVPPCDPQSGNCPVPPPTSQP
ncbi:hypothetical protein ACLB0R_13915 [Sphingomonas sp. GlSt437]